MKAKHMIGILVFADFGSSTIIQRTTIKQGHREYELKWHPQNNGYSMTVACPVNF
ncbi:hypothetical protein [Streptococcus cuniculi]|uniref:hypothetical protein n=1 Tax=Streptococcus cuniculi TaxID=1432788 RepID=UPI000A686D9A|nr:hypothetical protein [Streptococcus cuniculi]